MKGGHKAAFRRSLEDLTVLMDHDDGIIWLSWIVAG